MTGQEASAGEILGPFTDIVQRVGSVAWETAASNVPGVLRPRTLLLTVFIATLIFLIRRGHGAKGADGRERKSGLLSFLLPKDNYTHKSARVDVSLWVLT